MKTSCFHYFITSFYACKNEKYDFLNFGNFEFDARFARYNFILIFFRHSNHVNGRAGRRATDYSQLYPFLGSLGSSRRHRGRIEAA